MKLKDLKNPIRLITNSSITLELVRDRGKLWINDDTHCILRICMLPDNTDIQVNKETGFLDITLP